MYVLGLNGGVRPGYQDISAVVLRDGEVIAAVEEERLNRIKYSPGQLPQLAINEVLKIAGIEMKSIQKIGSHGMTWGMEFEQILHSYIRDRYGYCPKIERVHHHDAHAASTYFASGFDRAMILTIDTSGDGVSTQLAAGTKGDIKVLDRISRPNSLGLFYSMITQYCGFSRDGDEYKLMGLSSYGKRDEISLDFLLDVSDDGVHLNEDYLKPILPGQSQPSKQQMCFSNKLIEKLGPHRQAGDPVTTHYQNVAAAAQAKLEEAILHYVTKLHTSTGLRKICLAGGVALNCVANQVIMNLDFIDDIYIQPAAGDAGISLGAAWLAAKSEGDSPRPMAGPFLGSEFTNDEIEQALRLTGAKYDPCEYPAEWAAEQVSKGKVVGWFQGRMEYGPRALGARSILADPTNGKMQDQVNKKIKFRETFRPFCPSVLREDKSIYFEGAKAESPYMTITYNVKKDAQKQIPSVTHVDGTARIQTVDRETTPLYHNYLSELRNRNGHGVSMNTSFNRNNEPIVNTCIDALSSFYGSGMDALCIGNFMLTKK